MPDPSQRGRYILTDPCVAVVACAMCKSIPGEPCKRHYGIDTTYHTATHYVRRNAAKRVDVEKADDVIRQTIFLKLGGER